MGLITAPGRYPRATNGPQLLGQPSRAPEPQLLSPRTAAAEALVPRAQALQREKPPEWEAYSLELENACISNKDTAQPKINKYVSNYTVKIKWCNYFERRFAVSYTRNIQLLNVIWQLNWASIPEKRKLTSTQNLYMNVRSGCICNRQTWKTTQVSFDG